MAKWKVPAGSPVVAGQVVAVFEADRADRQIEADSEAGGEFDIR